MNDSTLPNEERKRRISVLLRKVDEEVKKQHFDIALEQIRKVYQYDLKNIYARAYEERILVMMLEREREEIKRESEKQTSQEVEAKVKNWMEEFHAKQAREQESRKTLEAVGSDLEKHARESATNEMMSRMKEVEQRLSEQMRKSLEEQHLRIESESKQRFGEIKLSIEPTGDISFLKKEYEAKLQSTREEIERETQERLAHERAAIQEETFAKLSEEHCKTQEELMRQMEEERETIAKREQTKMKEKSLVALESIFFLTMRLNLDLKVQGAILQTMSTAFDITDEEYATAQRNSQLHSYVSAVRTAWENGTPSAEELQLLENLKQLYQISDDEHSQTVKKVKKELGLPDDTAIILVIDDDPAILRFVGHTLKHTYQNVLTASSIETALSIIQQTQPALILSDVQMPGTGGFTFYEKIVNGEYGEELKSIPFALMSAVTDEFFVKSAKQLGIRAYVTKPFTRESLESTIYQALN